MPRIVIAVLLVILVACPAEARRSHGWASWRNYPPHLHPHDTPELDEILLAQMRKNAAHYAGEDVAETFTGTGDGRSTASLYTRLGGHDAIAAVISAFVDKLVADPVQTANPAIKRAFGETDVPKLKKHLTEFVGSATGGPEKYTGEPNKPVHKDMAIGEKEWGAAVQDLIATLNEFKVPQSEQDELISIVATTKGDIVTKP